MARAQNWLCVYILSHVLDGVCPTLGHLFRCAFSKLLYCVAGGIPVLIAAASFSSDGVTQGRKSAALAMDIVLSLTSRAALPLNLVDEAEGLLLRLQAIPRLSWFLKAFTNGPSTILAAEKV